MHKHVHIHVAEKDPRMFVGLTTKSTPSNLEPIRTWKADTHTQNWMLAVDGTDGQRNKNPEKKNIKPWKDDIMGNTHEKSKKYIR